MSKEKQVEEMAEELRHSCEGECFKKKDGFVDCDVCKALLLYNAGYRKQSEGEWIAKSPMIRSPFARNHYCSVCKYEPIETMKFCPECGAKMKGGAE